MLGSDDPNGFCGDLEVLEMNELRNSLLEQNIINIDSWIDLTVEPYVHSATLRLQVKKCPDVQVLISSDGGSEMMGLHIYDLLRLYPGKEVGKVLTYARSIAAIILQACDQRICARHARIRIHNVRARGEVLSFDRMRSSKEVAKLLAELEKGQVLVDDILMKRTGQSLKEIRRVCKRDRDMTAQEAKDFGLIDEII